ncbi:MAG: GrpB family protein [Saprospiraceae bacterium]|nr:GrpB family protein [Saprospiraceae bacterium]
MYYPIIIENYNPQWAINFQALKSKLLTAVAPYILEIQHVGSTSIPDLAAKPILDVDIIIDPNQDLAPIIQALDNLGYNHLGDLGIEKREAFRQRSPEVPYGKEKNQENWQRHNLYVCPKGCLSLENHLRFRDFLLQHPEAIQEYATLKKGLAQQFPNNVDLYCEAKTEFITNVLSKTGIDTADLEDISQQNKVE